MTIVRIIYFLAAFAPLHLLVAISAIRDESCAVFWLAVSATTAGVIANLAVLWRFIRRSDGIYADITSIQEDHGNVTFYIFSIIPIFLAASFGDVYQSIIFSIVYFCVVVIAVTTRITYANPILYLMGIRLFTARIVYKEKVHEVEILSKRDKLFAGQRALLARMGRYDLYVHGGT